MEELGVGIVGYGFIGKVHAYAYRTMPFFYDPPPLHTRLVGVATSRDETARKAAQHGGFEFGTADWRELIARDDIHIINICSPNDQHLDQVLACIEAGKHVYCDKPLVTTPSEIERLDAALPAYDGIGQMTFQCRFFPATMRALQLARKGFLGEIVSFRAAYLHAGNVDPTRPAGWKLQRSAGAGVLQDLGSHAVDLVEAITGPFVAVNATMRTLYPARPAKDGMAVPIDGDDHALLTVRLPNGALGTIEASKIATGAEDELRFEIHGDRGAMRFNLMEPNYLEVYDMRKPETPQGGERGWTRIACVQRFDKPGGFPTPKASIGWLRGHVHCLYSFLYAVAQGRQSEPSLQRGLQVARILAAASESAAVGAWRDIALQ